MTAVGVMVRLTIQVDRIVEALEQIRADARAVAADLVKAQASVDNVAVDLAASHDRAGAVADDAVPGEAADAASRTPHTEA